MCVHTPYTHAATLLDTVENILGNKTVSGCTVVAMMSEICVRLSEILVLAVAFQNIAISYQHEHHEHLPDNTVYQ